MVSTAVVFGHHIHDFAMVMQTVARLGVLGYADCGMTWRARLCRLWHDLAC